MEFKEENQKRLVLLFALRELGGSASRKVVLEYIQNQSYWKKNDQNDVLLETRNELKWRNDLSYVRKHLASEGYLARSISGVWTINLEGLHYLNHILIPHLRMMGYQSIFLFTRVCYAKIKSYWLKQEEISDSLLFNQLALEEGNKSNDENVPVRGAASKAGRYPRSAAISKKALELAGHCCTINPNHPSFLRRDQDVLYMEPHHFIPVEMTGYFKVNLDLIENIFSLCSNCHNQIHYGKKEDARKLVETLFSLRKAEICHFLQRDITLEELYHIYDISDS